MLLFVFIILFLVGCSKTNNIQIEEKDEQLKVNFDVKPSSRCDNIQDENKKTC